MISIALSLSVPLLLIAGAGLGAIVWMAIALRSFTLSRIHGGLLLLRLLGLGLLCIAILHPFLIREKPDPNAFSIAILADNSLSMQTRDLPENRSRLDWLNEFWLDSDSRAPLAQLRQQTPFLRTFSFSSELAPASFSSALEATAGESSLGNPLEKVLKEEFGTVRQPLAGVLVLSDGAHLSGLDPIRAARQFAEAGIPVSTVGLGNTTTSEKVKISLVQPRLSSPNGQPTPAGIELKNSNQGQAKGRVRIRVAGKEVYSEVVTVPPAESTRLEPLLPGRSHGIYSLEVDWVPEAGEQPASTAQGLFVVDPPPTRRLLILAARPDFELRAIRQIAAEAPLIELVSYQQIAEGRILRYAKEAASEGVLPEPVSTMVESIPMDAETLFAFDAILMDEFALQWFSGEASQLLVDFASRRSGGILLIGSPDAEFPSNGDLRNLFPVRETEIRRVPEDQPLEIEPFPVFREQTGSILFDGTAVKIPAAKAFDSALLSSRSAIPLARLPSGQAFALGQSFGAGRTAWIAAGVTWRWHLQPSDAPSPFPLFWEGLLDWLTSGERKRVKLRTDAQVAYTDSPVDLGLRLLDDNFLPTLNAEVQLDLIGPDGEGRNIRLNPDPESPGDFRASLPLATPGFWQASYQIRMAQGETFRADTQFALSDQGPEASNNRFNEQLLRDIARITGGRYFSATDYGSGIELPVGANVPLIQTRWYWTRTWPFLLIALTFLALEWWLRRRFGLR